MPVKSTEDRILSHFHFALRKLYGNQLDRVTLFGSRAGGDAHPKSDYDTAVFSKKIA